MSIWFSFGGATYFSVFVEGSSVINIASSNAVFCVRAFSTSFNACSNPLVKISLSQTVGKGKLGSLLFLVPISVVRRLMS